MQNKAKISSIAKSYAEALYEIWQAEGVPYGYIYNTIEIIKETLEQSPDLKAVLTSPTVPLQKKFEIADEVYKILKEPRAVNFVKILIEKNRLNELDGIMAAYKNMVDKKNNFEHVEVTSAIELNDAQRIKVLDKLEKKLKKKLFIDWETNPEIIGGLVVSIEENVLDLSLKKKIEDLSKTLLK